MTAAPSDRQGTSARRQSGRVWALIVAVSVVGSILGLSVSDYIDLPFGPDRAATADSPNPSTSTPVPRPALVEGECLRGAGSLSEARTVIGVDSYVPTNCATEHQLEVVAAAGASCDDAAATAAGGPFQFSSRLVASVTETGASCFVGLLEREGGLQTTTWRLGDASAAPAMLLGQCIPGLPGGQSLDAAFASATVCEHGSYLHATAEMATSDTDGNDITDPDADSSFVCHLIAGEVGGTGKYVSEWSGPTLTRNVYTVQCALELP